MEGDILLLLGDRHPPGCLQADLCDLVTGDAFRRTAAQERRVAGEAIPGDLGMGIDGLAGNDHQVG